MKRITRISAIAASTMLALTLAGCSSDAETKETVKEEPKLGANEVPGAAGGDPTENNEGDEGTDSGNETNEENPEPVKLDNPTAKKVEAVTEETFKEFSSIIDTDGMDTIRTPEGDVSKQSYDRKDPSVAISISSYGPKSPAQDIMKDFNSFIQGLGGFYTEEKVPGFTWAYVGYELTGNAKKAIPIAGVVAIANGGEALQCEFIGAELASANLAKNKAKEALAKLGASCPRP